MWLFRPIRRQELEHIALHAVMGIWHPVALICSALWAIAIEIGDEVKARRDPARHPEGGSFYDLLFRLLGVAFAWFVLWQLNEWIWR